MGEWIVLFENCRILWWNLTRNIFPAGRVELENHSAKCTLPSPLSPLFSHISTNFQSDRALSFFRSQQFCIQPKSFWTKNNKKKLPIQLPFSKLPINVHQHILIQVSHTVSFVLWYHFLQMIHIIWVELPRPFADIGSVKGTSPFLNLPLSYCELLWCVCISNCIEFLVPLKYSRSYFFGLLGQWAFADSCMVTHEVVYPRLSEW